MNMIKNGDIVTRNSYQNDILFYVEKIIDDNRGKIAILKGITIRIEADSPVEDLKLSKDNGIKDNFNLLEKRVENFNNFEDRSGSKYGKILHIDGDKNYSEKTELYYKKRGLNYIVKHIAEYRQPENIIPLLRQSNPDVLVITGHDGMIKRGRNYNDINNYRNSKHFIRAVKQARIYNANKNDLIIFAGACQSFYEALISAGANFASSPARILIDFMDPLIVAESVSTTEKNKIIFMSDLEHKIRNGRKAVGGIGARGKKNVIQL